MADIKIRDLTKSVAAGLSVSEERGGHFMDALLGCIRSNLASGKDVQLSGFGAFTLVGADGKPLSSGNRANLVGDVCAKLGEVNESRVKGLVEALAEAVKKELLGGKRVVLDDLGALEIKAERPQIERQPKGHRLIKAAASVLSFGSPASLKGPGGEGKVAFEPADDLKRKLDNSKDSSIMLVVPERDFFTKTLEYYFENAGWDIEVYTKVVDGLAKIENSKAYLVVLDALFEDYQKFCYALKMRHETTNVPLVLLYPSEQSFKVLPEVSIVGDANLAQPFEFRQLLDLADAEIIRAAEEELIFLQQMHIHLPTDEPSIEKVIDTVHKLLEGSGLNEEGQVAMSAAFREAVVNAAQHGNKYKRDRKIEVQYLLDAEKITAVVKDQGQGFNHEQYVKSGNTKDAISAARERHAQGRMGGLGIMLMLRCCDRLEYNQAGNQITLTKYVKPQA
jgi:serine/threonine-protein kinase RsbW